MGGYALAGVKMQHPGTWEGGKHRKWMFKKPSSQALSKVQPLSIGLSLTGKGFRRKNRKVEKGKNVRKMDWLKIPSFCFDLELLYFHSSLSFSISQSDFGTLDCHSSSWPFPHFRSRMSETMSLQALTSSPLLLIYLLINYTLWNGPPWTATPLNSLQRTLVLSSPQLHLSQLAPVVGTQNPPSLRTIPFLGLGIQSEWKLSFFWRGGK